MASFFFFFNVWYLWARADNFDLCFPYDPIASKTMFSAGQCAIWYGLYFLFALHLDTGASHLFQKTKVSVYFHAMAAPSWHEHSEPD